jgi:hypothetical protein
VVGLAVVAAVAVVGLNLLATRLERRTTADETAEIRSV